LGLPSWAGPLVGWARVFGVARSVVSSTLPPGALAGTELLGEKSVGRAVAATAGLPRLTEASSSLSWLAI
jgi:hypothetical protein